jgi:hypothetical protein
LFVDVRGETHHQSCENYRQERYCRSSSFHSQKEFLIERKRNINIQQQDEQQPQEMISNSSNIDLSHSSDSSSDLDATIGPNDVLCGRHKAAFNNIGNRRFRVTISFSLHKYVNQALTRGDKSVIIQSIVEMIKDCGGRFLQSRSGEWVEMTDKHAREKVGHALRDMSLIRDIGVISSPEKNVAKSASRRNSPGTEAQSRQAIQRISNIGATATDVKPYN